ncbi:carbonic anhydrase [Asticcacaulis sp. AC466]|uniref:carbonic anhydrase n=1 Tax=Asticcacaulis sp. AC466 TaxID=1282362 RepID=UPI00040A21B1|nr:carbonic anhydrase family protein [Asticcacaulis sp. AC466]
MTFMTRPSPGWSRRAAATSLMVLSLAACSKKADEHAPEAAHGAPAAHGGGAVQHWTYDGETGPQHWAEMGGDNTVCATGQRQSPIDISGPPRNLSSRLVMQYKSSLATIQNNGHTIVVTPSDGGGIVLDGVMYTLKQFHFHSPSEHAINGRSTALETHFVHQNAKGEYLIIAVLSDIGNADPVLGSLWTYLPTDPGKPIPLPDLLVNAQDHMPGTEDFYVYSGSLTTPPCTEAATWMVYSSPLTVSSEQADAFQRIIGPNARPLQPRHDRDILHLSGS